MLKMMDIMSDFQGQLPYVCVMGFYTDKTFAKVINHIFLVQLIFLNQHHDDGRIRGCKVKDEISSVVNRMQ